MVDMDEEERALAQSYELEDWKSIPAAEQEKRRFVEAAKATMLKNQRVNIRLTQADLTALRRIATEEGLPYQTLLASVLHKYATGRLVERARRAEQE